jgi:putative membrane protein
MPHERSLRQQPHGFPRRLYAQGEEPDPRFSLANERTVLAWVRTSLALTGLGIALHAFDIGTHPTVRGSVAVVCIMLGALTPLMGWRRWLLTEHALRARRPLPRPGVDLLVLATALAIAGIALGLGIL